MAPKPDPAEASKDQSASQGKRKKTDAPAGQPPAKKTRGDYCEYYSKNLAEAEKKKDENRARVKIPDDIDITDGKSLDDCNIAVAIFSVTEAVSLKGAAEFCLYDALVWNSLQGTLHGRVSPFNGPCKAARKKKAVFMPMLTDGELFNGGHVALAYIRARNDKDDGREIVRITVMDSFLHPRLVSRQRKLEKDFIRVLQLSGWYKPMKVDDYQFTWTDDVVRQTSGTACGFHVILNAWVIALGLKPTKRSANQIQSQSFNHDAARLIRCAVHGAASFDLIFAFLVCHGFADAGATVGDNRRLKHTFEIHGADLVHNILTGEIEQQDVPDLGKDPCGHYDATLRIQEATKDFLLQGTIEELNIQVDRPLETYKLILAILSVTEAISQRGSVKFSLYDAYRLAPKPPHTLIPLEGKEFNVQRTDCPILMPWAGHPAGSAKHHVLVVADRGSVDTGGELLVKIYDSNVSICYPDRGTIENNIKHVLEKSWHHPPNGYKFKWETVVVQHNINGSGIHVILSAWAIALGLELTTKKMVNLRKGKDFYTDAARLITCAVHGVAERDTILGFLQCWGLVKNHTPIAKRDRNFATTCSFHNRVALEDEMKKVAKSESGKTPANPPKPDSSQNGDKPNSSQDKPDPGQDKPNPGQDKAEPNADPNSGTPNKPQEKPKDAVCAHCPVKGHCPESSSPRAAFKASVGRPLAGKKRLGTELSPSLQGNNLNRWLKKRKQEVENLEAYGAAKAAPDLPGDELSDADMILAITSVTEAISLNNRDKEFAFYSASAYERAKAKPVDLEAGDVALAKMKELLIPFAADRDKKGDRENMVLARIRCQPETSTASVDYYHSTDLVKKDMDRLDNDVKLIVQRLNWWPVDGGAGPNWQTSWIPTRAQLLDTTRGIHVVLDAWSLALGQTLDETGLDEDLTAFSNCIRALIKKAIHGCADSDYIVAVLRRYGWVKPAQEVPPDRRFDSTCSFPTADALRRHVNEQQRQMNDHDANADAAADANSNSNSNSNSNANADADAAANAPARKQDAAVFPLASDPLVVVDALDRKLSPDELFRLFRKRKKTIQGKIDASRHNVPKDVPWRRGLKHGWMVEAITAVTETITLKDQGVEFGIYSAEGYKKSRKHKGQLTKDDGLFKGKDGFFLPLTLARDGLIRNLWDTVLIRVQERPKKSGIAFDMTYYVSGETRDYDADVKSAIENEAKRLVRDLYPDSVAGAHGNHIWALAKKARGPAASGIHAVLDAWALALGQTLIHQTPFALPRASNSILDDTHYNAIADMINMARHGYIDSTTIIALLRGLKWITRVDVPPNRSFKSAWDVTGMTADYAHPTGLTDHMRELFHPDHEDPEVALPDDPDCLHCPIEGHCPRRPTSVHDLVPPHGQWTPAFWPKIVDRDPCRFLKQRLAYLEHTILASLLEQEDERKWLELITGDGDEHFRTMFRAIASVTEAITMNGYRPDDDDEAAEKQKKQFALTTTARWRAAVYEAQQPQADEANDPARHPLLRHDTIAPDVRRGAQFIAPGHPSYFISAVPRAHDPAAPASVRREVTHHLIDQPGVVGVPEGSPRGGIEHDVDYALRTLHWWGPADDTDDDEADPADDACGHAWRSAPPPPGVQGAVDLDGNHYKFLAALHSVCGAWAVALGLRAPPADAAPLVVDVEGFWTHVMLAVRLALHGLLDSATLTALLRCKGYVAARGEDGAWEDVPESRRFGESARFLREEELEAHVAWVEARVGTSEGRGELAGLRAGPGFERVGGLLVRTDWKSERKGEWGEEAVRRMEVEVEAEAMRGGRGRGGSGSGSGGRRCGYPLPATGKRPWVEVEEPLEVQQLVKRTREEIMWHWGRNEVHRCDRGELKKYFRNPRQNLEKRGRKQEMVDAIDDYGLVEEDDEADEGGE